MHVSSQEPPAVRSFVHKLYLAGASLIVSSAVGQQCIRTHQHHAARAARLRRTSIGFAGHRRSTRLVASVASRLHPFSGAELCPTDLTQWRALRSELDHRHEARRVQYRFRKSPESYLAALEEKLIKERLPS